jgi:peptide/nickel transport system substrate-binding protein
MIIVDPFLFSRFGGKSMNKKSLLSALLLAVVLTLSACGPKTASTTEPTQPPTTEPLAGPIVLKIANTATFTTWSPIKSFSTEAAYMGNMYEQLLRINPPGSAEKFTPLLATDWEVSTDGLVWTFHIRPGVKFHDGESLNAEAVVKSLEAARAGAVASFIWAPVDTIEAVDDMTVQFTLYYPTNLDVIASSVYGAWIISPKALDAVADNPDYFEAGVEAGTGPYMLESYTPDQEIVFTRFDDYWGGWQDSQFDKVVVSIVGEAVTQQQMLEGGQVDLVTRMPVENYEAFKTNPDYTYYAEQTFFNYTAFFNTLRPPLDNVLVRQALSYAIPYEDIISVAADGLATQSYGAAPQGCWPWSDKVNQYTYDLDKARDLLEQAGYAGGGFSLRLTYTAENDVETAFVPLIKDSFAQIGVDVTLEALNWTQQWATSQSDPANAQDIFVVLYWPTYADAGIDNMWSMFHGTGDAPPYLNVTGWNFSYWKDDTYNALWDEAYILTGSDPAASQVKYIEANNRLVDQAVAAFIMDVKSPFVIPIYIQGFQYNINYPFTPYFFYELSTTK